MALYVYVEKDRTWEGPWDESRIRGILARARIASQFGGGRQVWLKLSSGKSGMFRRYVGGKRIVPAVKEPGDIDAVARLGRRRALPAAHKGVPGPRSRSALAGLGSMDRRTTNIALMTILTTLKDMGTSPQTPLYLALQEKLKIDISDWQMILIMLSSAGLAVSTGDTLRLTAKGKQMAEQIEASIGSGGSQ